MNVGGLLRKLSFNELASMNLGNEGKGNISTAHYERLIDKTNNALLDLYTRFPLLEKELVLRTYDWKSNYLLTKAHAVSNEDSTELKYILDTPDNKFLGDLIFITGVANEIGESLPINDREQYASVFTPQTNQLQLTHTSDDQAYFVSYQAKHPDLVYNPDDLDFTLVQELEVPVPLETALRHHVASGIFAAMSGQGVTAKSESLMALYETECAKVEEKNLLGVPDLSTNTKLERRGFI